MTMIVTPLNINSFINIDKLTDITEENCEYFFKININQLILMLTEINKEGISELNLIHDSVIQKFIYKITSLYRDINSKKETDSERLDKLMDVIYKVRNGDKKVIVDLPILGGCGML